MFANTPFSLFLLLLRSKAVVRCCSAKRLFWHRFFFFFFCKFCGISDNTLFKEPCGRLLLHKHSFSFTVSPRALPFEKRYHTYFLVEYFFGLTCRMGARVNLIFQTLFSIQLNIWDEAFFAKIDRLVFSQKNLDCRFLNRF